MRRALFTFSTVTLLAALLGAAAVIHQHSVQTFGAISGLPEETTTVLLESRGKV